MMKLKFEQMIEWKHSIKLKYLVPEFVVPFIIFADRKQFVLLWQSFFVTMVIADKKLCYAVFSKVPGLQTAFSGPRWILLDCGFL